ncbi:hypothetical protein AVHY2522_09255 [Acidovorax sp. SUPP2522]|uniref:hypothetical protein n=1 Tax=unclassified Acidovorax TaxID=2684926 RepID=UPI00234BFEC1|nr:MULTISPECIES: hypothetical protein [unclassified Acidovorax]WCM95815.1 hypothetical protein M5C96_15205 [Acidovorax sp. GBBC 1281]GKS85743.1 hypothetical protein AVMA1855_16345 [Acidovorax sp. SUPP1855]GKS89111.1 hypothetical protein AVTE2539_07120 [Acidovorax sp. SUPP2539]GKS97845.1 hypothetical protein AVKW3434_00675 [Acidovorax sp. SUPP3434]GKT15762.1 hypothetical protein AVHY2522_09255 [Acidovorax sp. SUPP2522]
MREQLTARLAQLKSELSAGEQQLRQLEARQAELSHTLMRIRGAIQVLEELEQETAPRGD